MRVALVGCSGAKAERGCLAKDFYISPLFRKSRAWAERFCDGWYIASGLHGCLDPHVPIEPYDFNLGRDASREYREERWPLKIAAGLAESLAQHRRVRNESGVWVANPIEVVILAGVVYADRLVLPLGAEGFTVAQPLRGMQIGERLHWLTTQLQEVA